MKRIKIAYLIIALIIITTLLTACSAGDIPVVGKLFSKDTGAQTDVADTNQDATDNSGPSIDAEYPPVPAGTVITIDGIFDILGSAGLSADTVAGYLILDANGVETDELLVTEDTYFTFIYQMRGADVSEQSQMVIGVKVTEGVVETPEVSEDNQQVEVDQPTVPAASKYEVFDYSKVEITPFTFSGLNENMLYLVNISNFNINKIPHSFEYTCITKYLDTWDTDYRELDERFNMWCIPKSYLYMQSPDYEDGSDLSVYQGEYILVLKPRYSEYTLDIYRSEDVILLPLGSDINDLAKEPSDSAKQECDFLMNEDFDDDETDVPDFYGAKEIITQIYNARDVDVFDNLLKTKVVDYSDMGTPDNMSDDIPWDEYEAGIVSGTQTEVTTGEQQTPEAVTTAESTTITETTTTTTTTESVIQTINEDVANSFRSRHPELFTFFPDSERVYSKWDWRIDDNTTVKGTVTLKDGTIIPQLGNSGSSYDFLSGTSSSSGSMFESPDYSSSSSSSSSSFETGTTTVGDEGYEQVEPEEEDNSIIEYEISAGNTKCKVTSNDTYRYMIDNQNSSSSEVYINHRDKRYTIKVVNESAYMDYWTKDYLNRSMNGYSITTSDYVGSTVADNNSIVLMNIQYEVNGEKFTEPYMAYIRNGSEYIIIIPEKAESPNSDVLADILKRCVAMQ